MLQGTDFLSVDLTNEEEIKHICSSSCLLYEGPQTCFLMQFKSIFLALHCEIESTHLNSYHRISNDKSSLKFLIIDFKIFLLILLFNNLR